MGQGHRKLTQINQSQLGGPLRVHFRCPWHIWGPLGGSKAKLRPFLRKILTFPDPPAKQVRFLWSKMGHTGVPHIVLHILCSTYTFWGHSSQFKAHCNWGKIITFWGGRLSLFGGDFLISGKDLLEVRLSLYGGFYWHDYHTS